jgi:hypothetical protein
MNEKQIFRELRLQGLKIRVKEAIINNRHVYLSSIGNQHTWVTEAEMLAIANGLASSGFCPLVVGRNGAYKLMLTGDGVAGTGGFQWLTS